jgi:hypothetical protein
MTPSAFWPRWPALSYVLLLLSTAVAQMPYNPTRLLHNGDHVYVFRPSSQPSSQFQLGSIDVSSKLNAASLPYTTLSPSLPFLNDQNSRAFTPVLDNGGNLSVYTGNCTQGATGSEVWSFIPASGDKQGSWQQENMTVSGGKQASTVGANYLSNGISFSSIVGGDATSTGAYFFGGMCPFADDTSSDWQSAANYSNLMVTLTPSSDQTSVISYQMDVSSSRGPPVPEAGFTMTGLSPTYSNRNDGSQTQQQNFVLIGGHTSAAFINMSQIALFSLPEQGWTFIGVEQSEETPTIDPRSGHTAVLSSDGQQIVVYGGWVGDIDTPAEPQLAILNIADGYGGNGQWKWVIPSKSLGGGPSIGSGLYGHGAAMLPGGVMMITGGYSIAASGSLQQREISAANTKAYFLNVTSNTWIDEYASPSGSSDSGSAQTGPLSSPSQKAGLGIGIGIGLAAVCGLFGFYMWYTRRLQKQRSIREKQLQDLSFTAHRYNVEAYSPGFDGREGHADTMDDYASQSGSYYFPPGTQGGQGWKSAHGQDVERTGLLLEIPSPTRGLRRNLSGRPAYAMGMARSPGQIHPIDELEEDEDDNENTTDKTPLTEQFEMSERNNGPDSSAFDNAPQFDPLHETHRQGDSKRILVRSASSSPILEDTRDHGQHIAEWPGPIVAGNRRSNTISAGRVSPEKTSSDERTNSNLSERSAKSDLSWTSSHGSIGRTPSLRAIAVANTTPVNPFRSPDPSPSHGRPRRYSESSKQAMTDARTTHASFAHLQAEGESLLGGNPEPVRPDTSSTSNGSNSHVFGDTEARGSRAITGTPATSHAFDSSRPGSRDARKSWLGSVRRVLRRSVSGTDRTQSLTNTVSYHEPYTDSPASPIHASASDHRKSFPSNQPPRRAASDATFWKSRRGQHDWEDEAESRWARNSGDDWGAPEDIARAEKDRLRQEWRERGNLLVNLTSDDELPTPRTPISHDELGIPSFGQRPSTPADEGDWDVEAAVERRVVQVMFTVPKSKLRVVNADPDGSSILSLPHDNSTEGEDSLNGEAKGSPSRVKNLAGKFEQMSAPKTATPRLTPRASPIPSPSSSVRSMKVRAKRSSASLNIQTSVTRPTTDLKAKENIVEE